MEYWIMDYGFSHEYSDFLDFMSFMDFIWILDNFSDQVIHEYSRMTKSINRKVKQKDKRNQDDQEAPKTCCSTLLYYTVLQKMTSQSLILAHC